MSQITNNILMIRPVAFRMNEETAVNNYFQEEISSQKIDVNARAQDEFDEFVQKLRNSGVNVVVEDDDIRLDTPDSIFPNNWISFHANGDIGLYPMFAENRRRERREEILTRLEQEGFHIEHVIDYTPAEEEGVFLEGTGSLVLDRVNKKAYCALSPRAHESMLIEFCEDFEYTPVIFHANQDVNGERLPIYHTNVMMAVAEELCVICLDSIDNKKEKLAVVQHLEDDGKAVIAITEDQMHKFAGNMLQLQTDSGGRLMVMSKAAEDSLNDDQRRIIEESNTIVSSDLTTIETCGGGSARCMMAEVFLPRTRDLN